MRTFPEPSREAGENGNRKASSVKQRFPTQSWMPAQTVAKPLNPRGDLSWALHSVRVYFRIRSSFAPIPTSR